MSLLPITLIGLSMNKVLTPDSTQLFLKRRSTQLKIAIPTFLHTPKETTPGMMHSTTNLTKSPGPRRPTSLLPITSTGLSTSKELLPDSTQLLPNRATNLLNSPQFNLTSQLEIQEPVPGLIPKPMTPTRMNGKLTSKPLELIILIQLKNPHHLFQIPPHLPPSSKRENLLTQLKTATPPSPHITRVSTHGLLSNTPLAMRLNGAKRLTSLLPETLIMLKTQDHQDWCQL
jgi:hypothetical protein